MPKARFKTKGPHGGKQRAHGTLGTRPIVAIVGRPNVGKSALFNRLAGASLAIVEDMPGVTRDRLYAEALALGHPYILIDTGGFDPSSDDPMSQSIAHQVRLALDEADVVIAVLDGTQSPLPADREAVALLRSSSLPVLYVANKADNPRVQQSALEHYELGIDSLSPVSALHGHGIGALEELLIAHFPEQEESGEDPYAELDRVAIVGRPNAGKSSLINRLLGEKRQIVDDRPGTTTDSIDTLLTFEDEPMVLIDTAGIRRKRAVDFGIESLAVMQAIRAVERSNVVVLMIDAKQGASDQDAKIAGLAMERGRALVIALNKGDLLSDDERKKAVQTARDVFSFATWAPIQLTSVESGRGVHKLMQYVRAVGKAHKQRIPTAALNRFFEEVLERHPPPSMNNRAVRIYYATQVSVAPPTFVIASNHPERVHFSYKRYVVNQLRERFGFEGSPVRVFYRGKEART